MRGLRLRRIALATSLSLVVLAAGVVLESLGLGLECLPGRDGVFITTPTTGGADGSAILTQGSPISSGRRSGTTPWLSSHGGSRTP
jgi:hypothetical protein